MKIHVEHVPFARMGSYLTFSILPPTWGHPGLVLRTMHRGQYHEVFHLIMARDGREVAYTICATPTLCTLTARDGKGGLIEICLPEKNVARLRGRGVSLRLRSVPKGTAHCAFPLGNGVININAAANRVQYHLLPIKGGLHMDMPVHISAEKRGAKSRRKALPSEPALMGEVSPAADGMWEISLHEYIMSPPPLATTTLSFDQCVKRADDDWNLWLRTTPPVPRGYREGAQHAMHVNYASTVGPWGNFKRNVMLMSRNWMTHCWSWDHCFNAIACSYRNPDLAWDQLNVHFDLQEPGGCLPDAVNAENCTWSFCKPPIHGWALSKMARNPRLLTEKRLKDFYPKLARWTDWWFTYRDSDGDGLPEYHHGNDSGWDNGTVFDKGFPLCGADLQAFLILQMDVLSQLAARMGRKREALNWQQRADRTLQLMIERLWDGTQFHGKKAFTYDYVTHGDCLLNHMPIVLGRRLPAAMRREIASALKPGGRFLTRYGLATESVRSPKYVDDGYWRGPIWGPEVVLIADGLRRGGHGGLAREIARRYCDMCRKTMTFAENFDALTGAPLCDKAYTWGSSAYLILAHEFLR